MVASTVHPRCHPCLLTPSRPSDSGGRSQRAEPHGPPPTSVHAYKSRQSRIPGGGLSRWSWAAVGWPKRAPQGDRATHPTYRASRQRVTGWEDSAWGSEKGFASEQGPYMQMVHIYRKQRAPYEYVKWETKQNRKKTSSRLCVCVCVCVKESRKIGWIERKRKWQEQVDRQAVWWRI